MTCSTRSVITRPSSPGVVHIRPIDIDRLHAIAHRVVEALVDATHHLLKVEGRRTDQPLGHQLHPIPDLTPTLRPRPSAHRTNPHPAPSVRNRLRHARFVHEIGQLATHRLPTVSHTGLIGSIFLLPHGRQPRLTALVIPSEVRLVQQTPEAHHPDRLRTPTQRRRQVVERHREHHRGTAVGVIPREPIAPRWALASRNAPQGNPHPAPPPTRPIPSDKINTSSARSAARRTATTVARIASSPVTIRA